MAGDEINMPANAPMMTHKPWVGRSATLKTCANMWNLDKVEATLIQAYVRKPGSRSKKFRECSRLKPDGWQRSGGGRLRRIRFLNHSRPLLNSIETYAGAHQHATIGTNFCLSAQSIPRPRSSPRLQSIRRRQLTPWPRSALTAEQMRAWRIGCGQRPSRVKDHRWLQCAVCCGLMRRC